MSLYAAGQDAGVRVKLGGTYLCMEGPAFSTLAESNLYRSWGMDVIGMTNLQEAKLAREAELCYTTIAMVTDYDCWHPEHDAVTVNDIIANLTQNAANAAKLVKAAVAAMPEMRDLQMRIGAGARSDHRPQGDSRGHSQEAGAAGWQVPVTSCWISAFGDEPWSPELLDRAIAEDDGRALVVDRGGTLGRPVRTPLVRRVCATVFRGDRAGVPRIDAPHSPGASMFLADGPRQTVSTCSRASRWAPMSPSPACCSTQRSAAIRRRKSSLPGRAKTMSCSRPTRASLTARFLTRAGVRCGIVCRLGGVVVRRWDRARSRFAPNPARPDPRLPRRSLCFFESRSFGGNGNERLPDLAARWADDPGGSSVRCAAVPPAVPPADITVSLGVGENPAKRLDDDFERELLQLLAETGASVLVDKGGSAEERERVERAIPTGAANARRIVRPLRRGNRALEAICRLRFRRRPRRIRVRSSAYQHRQGLRQRPHGGALATHWNRRAREPSRSSRRDQDGR